MDIKVLLLENSDFFGRALKYRIETQLGFQVLWYKSIEKFIESSHDYSKINIAIVDYMFPGSNGAHILDFCHNNEIPIVLLADEITHDIQEKIWTLKVIDYILKNNSQVINNILDVLNRYFNNPTIGILIVDGSSESREHLKLLLKMHKYKIFESSTGEEALDILSENYDVIKMVITDYTLEDTDGVSLTSNIRRHYPIDRLAIIGISAQGNHTLKIQFIKSGANDFLTKPFISELLYCRITQNIKIVEYFNKIKELAIIDQLTKLNNRHFLKETGTYFFENAKRHNLTLVTAMIDIDDFKSVNDTYGHDVGDVVLKEISLELKQYVRKSDLVIRFGGEEFLVIGNNLAINKSFTFFDNLRELIANRKINIGHKKIQVTISIGICIQTKENLEEIILYADKKLYEAKKSGKNKVCI